MIASAAASSAVLLVIALHPCDNYFMINSCKLCIYFQNFVQLITKMKETSHLTS